MLNTTSDRILQLLEEKGMTQREFANRVGVQEATISRYINGHRTPHSIIAVKMAEVLGTTVDYLFGNSQKVDITVAKKSLSEPVDLETIELAKRINKLSKKERKMIETILTIAEDTKNEQSVTDEKRKIVE